MHIGCCLSLLSAGTPARTDAQRGFIAFQSSLAKGERQRIAVRANDGRRAAKARGARFGHKPKLDGHQQAEALRRLLAGESARSLGKSYRVHHATISRLQPTSSPA
jgi:DNA invertase Pin-like site-specific DNA recombinase